MSDDNERQINEKYELRIKKLDSKVIRLSQEKDDLKLQYEVWDFRCWTKPRFEA